ncbi:hypothetical protein BCR44DRAFT_1539677 [Catenaria anguillulae PL171]|uniref:CCHC-type domain-containing protein n=1 Tax=Catenaria anguillulae PL171 TaxID=765915 RepID=A0A1Y2HWR9_9FUNG|nr:hypothetical protein BCR44DRAFT_1539677 [Catenaria anguillulae PL171]
MTDPMIVDAQASAITGWVGPVPFSVDPRAVIARLKPHYNVVTLLNQRTVAGIKFLEVTYNSHDDLALSISKPSTFFRGQYIHAMTSIKEWLDCRADHAKSVQILCTYDTVRQLPGLLAKGHALLVDNCRARSFSRVLWQYESKEDADAAVGLGEYALNGHDLRFFAGSARLCFSCGSLDHLRTTCPTRPCAKTSLPSFSLPAPAPTSAGGVSYADAAKQAVNKVNDLEKDLRGKVDDLTDKVSVIQAQLATFVANQEALLVAFKLDMTKQVVARVDSFKEKLMATNKKIEVFEERLESLVGSVKGFLADFEALKPELEMTMEDVAELRSHRAKTSERYMRVNRDLAIVEVDLKVALDELRLYDNFEERLAAAREKSWAHYAKEQGSIAYPDSFLSKS